MCRTERIQSQEKEGALELCSFSFLIWAKSSSITIEKQKGGEVIAVGSEERTAAGRLGGALQYSGSWRSCLCCAWRGKGEGSTRTPYAECEQIIQVPFLTVGHGGTYFLFYTTEN